MPNVSGPHIGLVIQNNDPERRNRCKIFIPYITSYATDILAESENRERTFDFVDFENPSEDMKQILNELKRILPWAEYAGPIFGGNSSYVYDSPNHKLKVPVRPSTSRNSTGSLVFDQFNGSNPYSNLYTTKRYEGAPSGTFSVPNVGAYVWCLFYQNNVNTPIYFASVYNNDDLKRIYAGDGEADNKQILNYPNYLENKNR